MKWLSSSLKKGSKGDYCELVKEGIDPGYAELVIENVRTELAGIGQIESTSE